MLLLLLRNADPGPGRPDLTTRLTRLSAAGVPERYRAFVSKQPGPDVALDGAFSPLSGDVTATYSDVATLAGALPKLAGTLAGTAAAPDFNHTLAGTFAPLAGSIAGTAAAPDFDHTIAGAIGPLQGGIAGTAFAPGTDATLAGELPKLSGAIAATRAIPDFDHTVSASLAALSGALTGTHTAPQFDAAIGGSLAALSGALTIATGAYGFTLSGSFPGLRGFLGDPVRPMLEARFAEQVAAGFAPEFEISARLAEITVEARDAELELAGALIDEDPDA